MRGCACKQQTIVQLIFLCCDKNNNKINNQIKMQVTIKKNRGFVQLCIATATFCMFLLMACAVDGGSVRGEKHKGAVAVVVADNDDKNDEEFGRNVSKTKTIKKETKVDIVRGPFIPPRKSDMMIRRESPTEVAKRMLQNNDPSNKKVETKKIIPVPKWRPTGKRGKKSYHTQDDQPREQHKLVKAIFESIDWWIVLDAPSTRTTS